MTNVDTGSSLLEPRIPESMARRVTNLDYFFPLRPQRIETLTLRSVIDAQPGGAPVFVKLDTQGRPFIEGKGLTAKDYAGPKTVFQ